MITNPIQQLLKYFSLNFKAEMTNDFRMQEVLYNKNYKEQLSTNPSLDPVILEKLLWDESEDIVISSVHNEMTTREQLLELYKDATESIKFHILTSPKLTAEDLLAFDNLFPVLLNENCPTELLVKHKDEFSLAVATNKNTPLIILDEYYEENDLDLMEALLENDNLPIKYISKLKNHEDYLIRELAKRR
jgi:hypothetical protein